MSLTRSKSRRRVVIISGLLLTVIGVSAAVVYLKEEYPRRLAVVKPGVLYRSSQPETGQLGNLVETYGIKTVLIVREGTSDHVPDEIEFAKKRGLNVVHIPVKSRERVPDDQIKQFFEIVDNPANYPVLIHCSAGRHRTGYLCALYRIERMSWPVDQAVREMLSFGFDTTDQSVVLDQLKSYQPGAWKKAFPASSAVGPKSASNKS